MEQHADICTKYQGTSITFHIILLGVGGTIYYIHTLEAFKALVLLLRA